MIFNYELCIIRLINGGFEIDANKDNILEIEKRKLLTKMEKPCITKNSQIDIFYGDEMIFIVINDKLIKLDIKNESTIIEFIESFLNNHEREIYCSINFNKEIPDDLVVKYEPDYGFMLMEIKNIHISIRNRNIKQLFDKLNNNIVFSKMHIYSSNEDIKKIYENKNYYLSCHEVMLVFYMEITVGTIESEYKQIKNYSDCELENYAFTKIPK